MKSTIVLDKLTDKHTKEYYKEKIEGNDPEFYFEIIISEYWPTESIKEIQLIEYDHNEESLEIFDNISEESIKNIKEKIIPFYQEHAQKILYKNDVL